MSPAFSLLTYTVTATGCTVQMLQWLCMKQERLSHLAYCFQERGAAERAPSMYHSQHAPPCDFLTSLAASRKGRGEREQRTDSGKKKKKKTSNPQPFSSLEAGSRRREGGWKKNNNACQLRAPAFTTANKIPPDFSKHTALHWEPLDYEVASYKAVRMSPLPRSFGRIVSNEPLYIRCICTYASLTHWGALEQVLYRSLLSRRPYCKA